MGPWPWVEDEQLADLDVAALTDAELLNAAKYRGMLAANTVPGHPDHARAVAALAEVFDEMERRQRDR